MSKILYFFTKFCVMYIPDVVDRVLGCPVVVDQVALDIVVDMNIAMVHLGLEDLGTWVAWKVVEIADLVQVVRLGKVVGQVAGDKDFDRVVVYPSNDTKKKKQ